MIAVTFISFALLLSPSLSSVGSLPRTSSYVGQSRAEAPSGDGSEETSEEGERRKCDGTTDDADD